MRDIDEAFNGQFKEQKDSSDNWLPVPDHKVPVPRPGLCHNNGSYSDTVQNFIKTHTLMDQSVPAFFGGRPIAVRTSSLLSPASRFTAVVVDEQVNEVIRWGEIAISLGAPNSTKPCFSNMKCCA